VKELEATYHCPFCGHIWVATGKSQCEPHVYIAECPECLEFGFAENDNDETP